MVDMALKIEAQLHLWPWSLDVKDETVDLMTGTARFPFFGSPVISLSDKASLFLSQRHEKFRPLGSSFDTIAGKYRLYETPHGVMADRRLSSTDVNGKIRVRTDNSRYTIRLIPQGAVPRIVYNQEEDKDNETELARTVIGWSQFFEDLIENAKKNNRQKRLPWAVIKEKILKIAVDSTEPRMALIVDIAERMHKRIQIAVSAARKILFRERRMLPAGQVAETDNACLRWLVRQPGESFAEKIAANRQLLLGIARNESYDTLENRVLKDFLHRCTIEGRRYIDWEIGSDINLENSRRAQSVKRYRQICQELQQAPYMKNIDQPPPNLRPNYVLQNDYRYNQIWKQYVRLLRREEEEDCLWDWQARTWADVARLLVSTALFELSQKEYGISSQKLKAKEIATSAIHLFNEQHLGCRVEAGSEPGPFLLRRRGNGRDNGFVLEIVHPDQASQHSAIRSLGRLGGHLYLVLSPLADGRRYVIVIWAVHTAGSEKHPAWDDISHSAGQALKKHSLILEGLREPDLPTLKGFVLASDIKSDSAEIHIGKEKGLPLIQIGTDQRSWKVALEGITLVIEDLLEALV
jgi:hypothetical protein